MPETIDHARETVEVRLRELRAEAGHLESAIQSLRESSVSPAPSAAKPQRASSSSANGKKKAPHGKRMSEFLAALEQRPGSTPTEIANQIGISSNQAHTLVRRLRQKGEVRKSGNGYRRTAKPGA